MYRKIVTDFWNDPTVEELNMQAKYLLLYLLTAPMGTISGCYEVTFKRISRDTDMPVDAVSGAMKELCDTNIVAYDDDTREVLIANWAKYNWNQSPNTRKSLDKSIDEIKSAPFRRLLRDMYENTSSQQPKAALKQLEAAPISVSVTDTDSVTGEKTTSKDSQVETGKHRHGEFSNVLLTDSELDKLKEKFPDDWGARIDNLSYYIGSTGKRYASHYRTILSWARNDSTANAKKEVRLDGRYAKYD